MKKLYFLLLVLFFSTINFAQNPEPLKSLKHETKNISATVWNDGFIGNNPVDVKSGVFSWKGENGIFCGGIIYGTSSVGSVNGSYGEDMNHIDDWRNYDSKFSNGFSEETIGSITFDQVSTTILKDSGVPIQNYGSGMTVIQKSYSDSLDNFIFFRYGLINTTGSDIVDLYVGHTTAWNIGNFQNNSGGIDLSLNLTYACNSDSSGPYFGVVAIDSLYGCKLTNCIPNKLRTETFNYISQHDFSVPTKCDIGTVGGTYINKIAQEDTSWITFAYVAGDSLDDLKENALRAIEVAEEAQNSGWSDIATSVDKNSDLVTDKYLLNQNYPNPFNPTTKISYTIPPSKYSFIETVKLSVSDVLGREVKILVNEKQKPGHYDVRFDGKDLSSGIYLYTLNIGDFSKTKKMILLK